MQVCPKGTNLEKIYLEVCDDNRIGADDTLLVSTFNGVIDAIRLHPKLECFEYTEEERMSTTYPYDEKREAVQCMRNRRVLLKFGKFSFLYGKCVASGEKGNYSVSE